VLGRRRRARWSATAASLGEVAAAYGPLTMLMVSVLV
jgi:hypothetical protein